MSNKEIEAILNNPEAFQNIVDEIFVVFDTDKSGQIDSQEFYNAITQLLEGLKDAPVITREQTDAILQKLDSDHSGKISKQEFSVLVRGILESFL